MGVRYACRAAGNLVLVLLITRIIAISITDYTRFNFEPAIQAALHTLSPILAHLISEKLIRRFRVWRCYVKQVIDLRPSVLAPAKRVRASLSAGARRVFVPGKMHERIFLDFYIESNFHLV